MAAAAAADHPPERCILVLHATGLLGAAYAPLAAALERLMPGFAVVALDLPGHGRAAADAVDAAAAAAGAAAGAATGAGAEALTAAGAAAYVAAAVDAAGLRGCLCLAHSGGAAAALLAAAADQQQQQRQRQRHQQQQQPPPLPLFRALYAFEAVACTPATHAFMRAAMAAPTATAGGAASSSCPPSSSSSSSLPPPPPSSPMPTAGQTLVAMALRRRARFSGGRAEMAAALGARPPFAAMDRAAFALYVAHGAATDSEGEEEEEGGGGTEEQRGRRRRRQQQQTPGVERLRRYVEPLPPPQQQEQERGQQREQQQQQRPVRLRCSPTAEAATYRSLDPPPAVPPWGPGCPVALAVAAARDDDAPALAEAFRRHEAVAAWLRAHPPPPPPPASSSSPSLAGASRRPSAQQQRAADSHPLHGVLQVLNAELAGSLPRCELLTLGGGVSHFAPLEAPARVAASAAAFFTRALADGRGAGGGAGGGCSCCEDERGGGGATGNGGGGGTNSRL